MKDSLKYLSLITQVGLSITFTVVLFTVLGVYLDRLLKTKAIFTLVFVLIGCFAALWVAYQLILKTSSRDSEPK